MTSVAAGHYQQTAVRQRMAEFLGRSSGRRATAAYLVGADGRGEFTAPAPARALSGFLEGGLDIERSLWDRNLLLFDLDIEYQNFDAPALAWAEPERVFALQEPVLAAALRFLRERLIAPLTLVSGRGYHLVWAIARASVAFRRLTELGTVPASLAERYAAVRSPDGDRVDPALGRAFAAQGRLVEYLAHRIRQAAMAHCILPVQLTAIEVGRGAAGREIISLDLSEYGDPFHTRHIRIPFSLYLKPREPRWRLEKTQLRRLLPIVAIPRGAMEAAAATAAARSPARVAALAESSSTRIPVFSRAMNRLIDEYEGSPLGQWHQAFAQRLPAAPPAAPSSAADPIPDAPPCLDWLFAHPNDWLLKPAALQHMVRVLTALAWPPEAIARRIHAAYCQDHAWGRTWVAMDPAWRAEFYTRLFAGMIATGADTLVDLNCVSHQEKGYCRVPDCRSNLAELRDRLQARRTA
jgi:hypothetical protein